MLLAYPRSAAACFPSRVTQHKLQSDLQMAATCAGLGGAQERPSCKPMLAAASARPGPLSKGMGILRPNLLVWGLWIFEILGKSPAGAKTVRLLGEATGKAWVSLQVAIHSYFY